MPFSISTDQENYSGNHSTEIEALEEAFADNDCQSVWVGEDESPTQPEEFWQAEYWLEHVSCQEEYGSDWAEGWDQSTKEQREELENEVSKVMAAWLDRHNLRPKFFLITKPKRVTREQFEEMKQAAATTQPNPE